MNNQNVTKKHQEITFICFLHVFIDNFLNHKKSLRCFTAFFIVNAYNFSQGDISPFKDQTNLDDDASAGSCTGGGDEARFNAKLEDQKGTVAEMFGNTLGISDMFKMYFEKRDNYKSCGTKSVDVSSQLQTITFYSLKVCHVLFLSWDQDMIQHSSIQLRGLGALPSKSISQFSLIDNAPMVYFMYTL